RILAGDVAAYPKPNRYPDPCSQRSGRQGRRHRKGGRMSEFDPTKNQPLPEDEQDQNQPEIDDAPVNEIPSDEEQPGNDAPVENGAAGDAEVAAESAGDEETDAELEEEVLPLLPLRGTVVLPMTLVPLAAAQERSLRLIDDVMGGDRTVAMVMQKDAELEG